MSGTFAHFNNSAIRRLRQAPSFLPTPLSYSPPSQTCARRDTHPVLSIVVPAYNLARYVEQCVRAILGQLREHHELIVIDDGSTDNTLALVTTLQQAWPGSNFHVKSQANEGIAGVRNHGVRAATGDYIVWIDGDDVLQGGILDKLDEAIARHRPDVIVCDYTMWHPQEPAKTHPVAFSYPDNVMLRDVDAILTRFFACRKNYIWATVFRRDIYAQLPGPVFPPAAPAFGPQGWLAAALLAVLAITALRFGLLAYDRTDLFVDEAQYWLWGQSYEFGYYSKPPLIGWLIGAVTALAGSDAVFWIRSPGPVLHAITALLVGALAARFGRGAAIVAVAMAKRRM